MKESPQAIKFDAEIGIEKVGERVSGLVAQRGVRGESPSGG